MDRLKNQNLKNQTQSRTTVPAETHVSKVYCPMCTHTVEAEIVHLGQHARVKDGQKCARCGAALDAGYIFRIDRAA